jgi:hypothetical protein
MGIPQVPRQLRRGPTLVLRAIFAGIGRMLLVADRPQASLASHRELESSVADLRQRIAEQEEQRTGPAAAASVGTRWRSLDQTGNVRLLSAADLGEYLSSRVAADIPAQRREASPGPHVPAARTADGESLPLADYDSLSLPSIRARLRSLDVSQLRVLANYERRNAERPEVLGMLERRIEKMKAGP